MTPEARDAIESGTYVHLLESELLKMSQRAGRYRDALTEIDNLAIRHERGAIGKAQKIARAALNQRRT